MPQEQRTVVYHGDVHGVGFRYTAVQLARRYDVSGYVRNLPDGQVELLVEGEEAVIGEFLNELAEYFRSYIRSQTQRTASATGSFSSFAVRY